MTYDELSKEQKHDVKENYMVRLADKGRFIKAIYGESADEPERGPTQGELYDADQLVSDEKMRQACEGICFSAEDFFSSSPSEQWRFTPGFISKWADWQLTVPQFEKDNDRLHTNCDIQKGIQYTKDKLKDLCDRFDKGQLTDEERKLIDNEKE